MLPHPGEHYPPEARRPIAREKLINQTRAKCRYPDPPNALLIHRMRPLHPAHRMQFMLANDRIELTLPNESTELIASAPRNRFTPTKAK